MRLQIIIVAIVLFAFTVSAQQGNASDTDYITKALSAAPPGVASAAAVIRIEKNGRVTTLRPGTNGFTCLTLGWNNMCADANGMAFMQALMKHVPPPNKLGIAYMLGGDKPGASNIDPYATKKTPNNHWVITGPHIMLLGPPSKALGYPKAKDPDPTKPYMMWARTPYEHAMIPVGSPK